MKVFRHKKGVLVNEDCLKGLKKVKSESVDLIMADPPFNIGYEYDQYVDSKDQVKYLSWVRLWTKELKRVLKPQGSIFVAIGDDYAGEFRLILDQNFHRRNWIIWHYTFGVYCKGKFGRDHTHIFYYTKDPKKFTFNADAIRVPSARQEKYNDKRAESKGRVPGDVWTFPRVCGTFKERTKHPCQMPEALLERVILTASDENSVVLDPFSGSGTTIAVANRLGRRWIGFEISREYCRIAESRLKGDTRL